MYVVNFVERRQPKGMQWEKEIERTLTFCYSKRDGLKTYYTDDSNSNTRSRTRCPDDEKKISVNFNYVKDEEDFPRDPNRDRNKRHRNRTRDSDASDYRIDSMDRRSSRVSERNRIRDIDRPQNMLQYHDGSASYNYNQNQPYDQIQDLGPVSRGNAIALEPLPYDNDPMPYLLPVNENSDGGFRGRGDALVAEPISYLNDPACQPYPQLTIEDRNNRSPGREVAFMSEPDSYADDPAHRPRSQPTVEGRSSPPFTEGRYSMSRANTFPSPFIPPKSVRFSDDVDQQPNSWRRRSRNVNDDQRPSNSGRRRSTR